MKPVITKTQYRVTCAEYFFEAKFFDERIEAFSFPVRDFDFSECCKTYGLPTAYLVWSLQKVRGINTIFVTQYSITVTMHKPFAWDTNIDKIVEESVILAWLAERKANRTKLEVNTYPNKCIRDYSVGAEISLVYFDIFYRNTINEEKICELGDTGKQIVSEVLSIPGVTSLSIKAYQLSVEISSAFSWDDIQPLVITALSRQLGELSI